jgi:hypothetical protein
MHSIKPGRGPSAMGVVMGVVVVLFGIFWTVTAFQIPRESPFPIIGVVFPLFGILFVICAVMGVLYNFRNATGRNRFSAFDITSPREESDPLDQFLGNSSSPCSESATTEARLRQLESLKTRGLITEAEHAAQRQRILSQV